MTVLVYVLWQVCPFVTPPHNVHQSAPQAADCVGDGWEVSKPGCTRHAPCGLQEGSCNALPRCLGAVGSATPALPHCLGAVGSGTPVKHCLTAQGGRAVEIFQGAGPPAGVWGASRGAAKAATV